MTSGVQFGNKKQCTRGLCDSRHHFSLHLRVYVFTCPMLLSWTIKTQKRVPLILAIFIQGEKFQCKAQLQTQGSCTRVDCPLSPWCCNISLPTISIPPKHLPKKKKYPTLALWAKNPSNLTNSTFMSSWFNFPLKAFSANGGSSLGDSFTDFFLRGGTENFPFCFHVGWHTHYTRVSGVLSLSEIHTEPLILFVVFGRKMTPMNDNVCQHRRKERSWRRKKK